MLTKQLAEKGRTSLQGGLATFVMHFTGLKCTDGKPTFYFGRDSRDHFVHLLVTLVKHQDVADDVGEHAGLDEAGEDTNLFALDVDDLGRVVLEKDAEALVSNSVEHK